MAASQPLQVVRVGPAGAELVNLADSHFDTALPEDQAPADIFVFQPEMFRMIDITTKSNIWKY